MNPRDDGEIVADSLEFEVDGALTNSVEIWASRQSAFPRSDVTINVKAKPNSFVGVMVCMRGCVIPHQGNFTQPNC